MNFIYANVDQKIGSTLMSLLNISCRFHFDVQGNCRMFFFTTLTVIFSQCNQTVIVPSVYPNSDGSLNLTKL